MWKFLVKNQSIEIVEREILADHQIQYVQFKFTFDGDWKRFHKVVQFSQCDEVYSVVLGTEATTLYLPAELHAGAVKMAVFGYDTESDTTVRATTVPVTLNIRESGFEGDEPPIPPTPDLYTQLLKRIEDAEHGLDGKSAYEIAVEHGYVGTEEEWLESLKGKDGVTPDMSEYPKTTEVQTIVESYPHFCCEENEYAIYYNQPDFNWGQTIYTMCVEPVHISSNRKIMLSYKSGATDIGEMWLVPKNSAGLSSAETARYIYEAIQNHSAISVPFGWLGTVGNYVNVLHECSGISAGEYYLAWKAITDNTSPMIRAVKVVDVTI